MEMRTGQSAATLRRGAGAVSATGYALGYSEREFKRLEFQSEFLRDSTENLLRRAGLAPGMHVLDIGCGVGDVSLLAGELVGPTGAVLGIDRSEQGLDMARRRAAAAGYRHLAFRACELDMLSTERTFDAVIGRLILGYLPDPAGTLRRLRQMMRSGGVFAFQEMALYFARGFPDGPHLHRCCQWLTETLGRAGFDVDMGGKLFAAFLAAGLPAPQLLPSTRVEGGPHSRAYDYLAETMRSLLPMAERTGVATAAEVDIDSLAERLRQEVVESNGVIVLPLMIGAWARLP
jgi:ubiquinone/menaquinone biosynthesis C-methylase UbiE